MYKIIVTGTFLIGVIFFNAAFTVNKNPCRQKDQPLTEYFKWKKGRKEPILMAHRMSPPQNGYSENSLQALQHMYSVNPCAIQEMDIRMSKDSLLLLLHDTTLDRTTTGTGKINQWNYDQISKLKLKDATGKILPGHHIPLLREALQFAKGRMIVALDMKPGTDPSLLMRDVTETGTINDVFIICYNLQDALWLNKAYPGLMLALGFNSWEQIANIEKSGLPFKSLIALTPGTIQEKSFYDKIHSMGIMVSFSAFSCIDSLPHKSAVGFYKKIWEIGGDIICTDSIKRTHNVFK